MKPRTLAVLLALVVGLGAFIWFYEREQPGSEEREALARRVLGVEREQVARLELHAGERSVVLERTRREGVDGVEQDEWRLRRPLDFAADYWQVDGLVRTLAELERVRQLEEFVPADVGLDPPRGRIVVELEGGGRKELRVGAEVPGSENLIVAVEGEPFASVVPKTLWESLVTDAADWRDEDLFAAERDDVREIVVESASVAAVRLAREEDGTDGDFRLAAPLEDRADQDAVTALLRELTGLRASEFLDAPPPAAEIGLEPPRARLVATLDDGEPFVLLWGAAKEGTEENYVKVGDLVVTTTAALEELLLRPAAEWRSRDWSSLAIYQVDQVEIGDTEGTLSLTRDEGSWLRGEARIDQGSVSAFLYAIDDAVAERIADPGEIALQQPDLTVTLATSPDPVAGGATPEGGSPEEAREERLELYAPTPDNLVPARVTGRDAILLLRRETRDEILAKLQAVRAAEAAGEEPSGEEQPSPDAESAED